jgi:hypothetical protein
MAAQEMSADSFKLNTREEVERFEALMHEYSEAKSQLALNHIPLVKAWDQLHHRKDGGRVFTALLDIYLNLHMVHLDLTSVGGAWNSNFSKGMLEGGSVLDSKAKFFGKMDIHRFASGFVLRYRAIWDKIMGLLLLLFFPEAYDSFSKSKSKKKSFREAASKTENIPQEFVTGLLSALEKFDNTFRTPEAHGTGALRKWSLTMEGLENNPILELTNHWNFLNLTLLAIGGLFNQQDQK